MPPIKKPQLVNRGPAGLLKKQATKNGDVQPKEPASSSIKGTKNKIVKSLQGLTIPIASLTLDPMNAKLHPERNMDAIRQSLLTFGQRKPIVVRKQGMVVVAGNGTLQAAIDLGWDKIAASVEPMTDAEAAGYGLADNRTSELGRWDFERVAILDKLVTEAKQPMIGWSLDELEVLRCADWTPPEDDGSEFEHGEKGKPISFTDEQMELIKLACGIIYGRSDETLGLSEAEALVIICHEWYEAQ